MKIQISGNHDFDKAVMIQETKNKLAIYEPISEALQSPRSHARTLERINDIKDAVVKGEESIKVTYTPALLPCESDREILLKDEAELNLYDACEKVAIEILNSRKKIDHNYNYEDIQKDITPTFGYLPLDPPFSRQDPERFQSNSTIQAYHDLNYKKDHGMEDYVFTTEQYFCLINKYKDSESEKKYDYINGSLLRASKELTKKINENQQYFGIFKKKMLYIYEFLNNSDKSKKARFMIQCLVNIDDLSPSRFTKSTNYRNYTNDVSDNPYAKLLRIDYSKAQAEYGTYYYSKFAFALEKLNSLVSTDDLFSIRDIRQQKNIKLENLGSEGLEDFLYRMCKIFNIEIDAYFPKKESVETQTDELVQKMHDVAIQKDDMPLEKVREDRFYLEDDKDDSRAFALNKSNSDISDLEAGLLQREKATTAYDKVKNFFNCRRK